MANLSEDIQCAGSDTRPPMLDRTDFASWQQRIRLYCRGKENGVNILKSIDEGPFQMGTFRETLAEGTEGALHLGPERPRVYSDLSPEDKERYNADIRATNILLQGLPKDIYTLINHYTDAKDIWDNVKMLLEGSELTKEDRESQLYDDFEHFRQNKGETIHDYYVRFAKLINDMRNIKMTMSRMQLNSKFVNNMLPEWGRFVTAVKLNRGLRDSNYDQLYAYLKQHEAHANENKMMLDRFTQHTVDPLALLSNGRQNRGQGNNAWGGGAAGYGGAHNRVGNANPRQARQIKCYNCNGIGYIKRNCTQPKRPQNSEYFKYKMLLMQAQENGVALDEEQLLFIAGGQDNAIDEDVDEQPVQDLTLNVDNVFQADDYDAFDSDIDKAPTEQTMFMDNLSYADPVYDEADPSYDSDILFEVHDHDHYQDAVCEHHEEHEMHDDVWMDDPNITMEEYIRLEGKKTQKHEKVFNWETAKYGKIWYDEYIHGLRSVKTKFPAIAFNGEVSSETLSCEPTVSSLKDEIDFRVSFDDSEDEDYMVIFDKNSFSYKKNSTTDLKTDLENNNEKVIPSLLSPEPAVSCLDDLDFFKDFENEFTAIVYNDAQMSKSDLLTKPILSPQHIDKFDLKNETSLSKCDEEEQNILNFIDLFPFNVIYPNDSKSDKDNDDDKINIKHSSGDMSVIPLPNVINVNVDAYVHGSNKLLETSHDTSNKKFQN
ncbi:retrovirus-related pol polyprotein from transposon TNT 1-94 [Tanacetum coccineum]